MIYVLITWVLLNHLFIYSAEPKSQLSLQEMALIAYVERTIIPELDSFAMQVDDFIFQAKRDIADYEILPFESMDQDCVISLAEDYFEFKQIISNAHKNGFVLHKALTDTLINYWAIALINKKMVFKLHDSLIKGKESIDGLFIKLYPFVRADGCIKTKENTAKSSLLRYFNSQIIKNYTALLSTSGIDDTYFAGTAFVREVIALPKTVLLDSSKNKTIEAINVFLDKLNPTDNKYALWLTVPLDMCPEQSLLNYLCEQKNIGMACEGRIIEEDNKEEIHIMAVHFSFIKK